MRKKIIIACFIIFLTIAPSAYAIKRSEVIARAYDWINRDVPYDLFSEERDVEGAHFYTRDCSNYISMAWHVIDPAGNGRYLTTFDLEEPWITKEIAISQLKPGDLLLDFDYHAILFEDWANAEHTQYWGLQETYAGDGANRALLNYPNPIHEYIPYRYLFIEDDPEIDPGQEPEPGETEPDLETDDTEDLEDQSPAPIPQKICTVLSLRAKPRTIKAGRKATLHGVLKSSGGRALGGKKIKLQARVLQKIRRKVKGKIKMSKKMVWRTIAILRTTKAGHFKKKLRLRKTTIYKAVFASDNLLNPARSPNLKISVSKK
ncbi:MAG: hypothetical protein C4562_05635 [Actinobacteria bacterium]|nr:MAG: hypothetical protein C4562_05635 [Actinomycetota bacterium]